MHIWTTFCPQKLSWELTTAQKTAPSSNWLSHEDLIKKSLQNLQETGISGIRLSLFSSEFTRDGEFYDFTPLEKILDWSYAFHMQVDLCVGPFQYPHYPGIRLPEKLRLYLTDDLFLDANEKVTEFGKTFLEIQLQKYGSDKRIRGFHLANEWPDANGVEGTKYHYKISNIFMEDCITLCNELTDKPIAMNTNFDVRRGVKQFALFKRLLLQLQERASLGLDVYPSQEKWQKVPDIMIRKPFISFPKLVRKIQESLYPIHLYFTEVEAQPWGDGKSWYQIINDSHNKENILGFSPQFFYKVMEEYILPSGVKEVSLWGSEFWLVAKRMGIEWPMEMISNILSSTR